MRPNPAFLCVAVLCVGCTASPTTQGTPAVFLVVSGPVDHGVDGTARLVNMTGSIVTIGDISCTVNIDRQTTAGWTPQRQRGDGCLAILNTVRNGEAYPFSLFTPSSPGTFRLRTYVNGDSVLSDPFIVR